MLQLIIFFIALWLTFYIITYFTDYNNKTLSYAIASLIIRLITVGLWTYLYYINT